VRGAAAAAGGAAFARVAAVVRFCAWAAPAATSSAPTPSADITLFGLA
jgi:hypothetical protein